MSSLLKERSTEHRGAWSDDDELQPLPSPLERVAVDPTPQPDPARSLVDEAVEKGLDGEVLDGLLQTWAALYPLSPSVRLGEESVYIWLPELALYAEGKDFEEASWDLVDEVLDYVRDWEAAGLDDAPNHAARRPWVRRIQLIGMSREKVYRILFFK
jgi:hypothetical protein